MSYYAHEIKQLEDYANWASKRISDLEKEVNRLKEGNFTEEEFQNLCHNKNMEDGYRTFVEGCNEYQKKLFGRCQNEDVEKRIEGVKAIERLKTIIERW